MNDLGKMIAVVVLICAFATMGPTGYRDGKFLKGPRWITRLMFALAGAWWLAAKTLETRWPISVQGGLKPGPWPADWSTCLIDATIALVVLAFIGQVRSDNRQGV
jgi:hypothetical protein